MNKGAIIREVEISAIEVLNPRERNQKVFQEAHHGGGALRP